jgi:hypothetical protein
MTKKPRETPGGKYAGLLTTVADTPAVDAVTAPAEAAEHDAALDDELEVLTVQSVVLSAQSAEIEQRIAEVLAKRPPRAQAVTPRYGRRAQADMVQLGVVIPTALKRRLAAFANERNLQLAEATEVLLDLALTTSGE